MSYTVTNDSPVQGSIAWTDLHVVYQGQDHDIVDGSTAHKYIWWDGTTTLRTSDVKPDIGDNDVLLFINEAGAARKVIGASVAQVVADGAVDTDALAPGAVTADKTDFYTSLAQAVADAQDDATAAQAAADGAIRTYYQASAPNAAESDVGDLWYDTDNDVAHRYDGSVWRMIQDDAISTAIGKADNAQAAADGKITTFYGTTAPVAEGIGDLWLDQSDGNRLHIWNGTEWADAQDGDIGAAQAAADTADGKAVAAQGDADAANSAAATAQGRADSAYALADGKIVTFFQDTAPGGADIGDLWMDSNDGNKLYRYSGSAWDAVQDTDIQQAISAASQAQSAADGKIVTFVGGDTPVAEGIGDLWIDDTRGNLTLRWTGSTWAALKVNSEGIEIDAITNTHIAEDSIDTPQLRTNAVKAENIDADAIDGRIITGSTVRTAASGERVELTLAGLDAYDSAGTARTSISSATGRLAAADADIEGSLVAGDPTGARVKIGYSEADPTIPALDFHDTIGKVGSLFGWDGYMTLRADDRMILGFEAPSDPDTFLDLNPSDGLYRARLKSSNGVDIQALSGNLRLDGNDGVDIEALNGNLRLDGKAFTDIGSDARILINAGTTDFDTYLDLNLSDSSGFKARLSSSLGLGVEARGGNLGLVGGARTDVYAGTTLRLDAPTIEVSDPISMDGDGWVAMSLANGWSAVAGLTVQCRLDAAGNLHIRGLISGGSGPAFNLPFRFRPSRDLRPAAYVHPTMVGVLQMEAANGNCTPVGPSSGYSWYALDLTIGIQ